MADFTILFEECDQWRQVGLQPLFWWRDDDAIMPTSALERLWQATQYVPFSLAVIPDAMSQDLGEWVVRQNGSERLSVLPHGLTHQSHASHDQKKQELVATFALSDAQQSFDMIQKSFSHHFVPVMVPPWNRCSEQVFPVLKQVGFRALSVFGPVRNSWCMTQINTHVDILDWHQRRALDYVPMRMADEIIQDFVRLLRKQRTEASFYPIGLLTHHLVQDDETWDFLHQLVTVLHDAGGVWSSLKQFLKTIALASPSGVLDT